MSNAKIYTDTIPNGETLIKQVAGTYFKLLSATGTIDVRTQTAFMSDLIGGQGMKDTSYDRLEIRNTSGASNTIRYIVADSEFIDGFTGSMAITQNVPVRSSSFTNTAQTVTSASAQLLPANTQRAYLLIQNNSTTGVIYITFGATSTAAKGIKIAPGGNFVMEGPQSTQAIHAIGDIASNAAVVTVEG